MRWLAIGLGILAGVPQGRGADPALEEANRRLLRGNYAEARAAFAKLARDGRGPAAASIGLSRACRSTGAYEEALQALDRGLQGARGRADLLAERADLLYLRGRWDEAQKSAEEALASDRAQYLAHWVLARLHADRGELTRSGQELVWFVRQYASQEPSDPEKLLLIGQAACERARRDSRLADQFQFVLSEVYKPLRKEHKDYWPAEYQAGMLFLEKYNQAQADKAFSRALTVNPRAAEVLASQGRAALQRYEVARAESLAARALQINPRLAQALRLRADVALMAGDTAEAMRFLDRAQAVNPWAEATLARVAACYHLDHKEAELASLVRQVERRNPHAGQFYGQLADRLDERKRYGAAEKYFRRAGKLRPDLTGPRNDLGLLYMRLGKEEEARAILDKAFEADPFNVRVFNTLQVLDHLKKYQTLKTAHFAIRYDPGNDTVLARFLAKYLEEIYAELAGNFQYRPEGPVLVEVFNKHTMFSGRVVALPDLHTIGACTGRMMALVSPHDRSGIIAKPFNWNRVLRHELTHIFNLDQTRFQVPHWLTEGLAVRSEQLPMPSLWHRILKRRLADDNLLNLDNIHLGFIRPRSQEDWHLAYLQSYLYVEYLTGAKGPKVIGELLHAYRDGLDTTAALRKACGLSKAELEKQYGAFLADRVKKVGGRPVARSASFEELKASHQKNPDDADVASQLAERYLLLGNRAAARKLAEAVLATHKGHALASYVQARLLVAGGQGEQAMKLLEGAVDVKAPEVKVLKLRGKLLFEAKQFQEAARMFELGRQAEPYEDSWLAPLARCYTQSGDKEKLIPTLQRLVSTDADDLDNRRELAQLLLKGGQPAEAERYARQALEIDVLDRQAQRTLQAALKAQNKTAAVEELHKLLGRAP